MFADRRQAGQLLAARLMDLRSTSAVVLGLPRGGVSVAAVVADALLLPLDVIRVRKLGMPGQPEVAMGAIGECGVRVLNAAIIGRGWISEQNIDKVEAHERETLNRRLALFRQGREPIDLHGRTAIIVDDGIATGATARAACLVARRLGAQQVVVAAPVMARDVIDELEDADRLTYLMLPAEFQSVGQYYRDFAQTSDEEVVELLSRRPTRQPDHTS